jgi:hypothetical protein
VAALNLTWFRAPSDLTNYDWVLKDGTPTYFECVDIFQFAQDGKIKQVSIIYDTAKIRVFLKK